MYPISDKYHLTEYFENNHPSFLLIPFRKADIYRNADIFKNNSFDLKELLSSRHPGKYITITSGARRSLSLVLNRINDLTEKTQNICIKTTSDNFYISGCVTKTIESSTTWSRTARTPNDILLINHEFGFADNRVLEIDKDTFIEDCAYSFASKLIDGSLCGSKATYSLYSFSKYFPIQAGGYLVSEEPIENDENPEFLKYIQNVVGYYYDKVEEWSEKRLEIHEYYNKVFSKFGCKSLFETNENNIPGVFLFNLPEEIDAAALKDYYWKRGVQCSVFYGKQAFYLPLNQFTSVDEVDFFANLFNIFVKNNE